MNHPSTYRTLAAPAYAEFKDKGSRFLAFAYPLCRAGDLKNLLEPLQKEHFKAVHHCYAYRLGHEGNDFRANDDGEPSGSAGRPILGQIDSFELTDAAVIVVRYFGGTLLGVPGLIHAYKTATREALNGAQIVELARRRRLSIECDYALLSEVLRQLKIAEADILEQDLQLQCRILADVPLANEAACKSALAKHHTIIVHSPVDTL
ncbi:MAG: YigZ family protein [Neisseria sp.]|nr:YigZ family protein [Neisseria sp.]